MMFICCIYIFFIELSVQMYKIYDIFEDDKQDTDNDICKLVNTSRILQKTEL